MLSDDALAIWRCGVEAVDAARLVREHVHVETGRQHNALWVGDEVIELAGVQRVLVVGAGKASAAMAEGLEAALGEDLAERLRLSGWVNVPEGTERPLKYIHLEPARPAGVNEPTERAVAGSREILRRVGAAGPRDLCIVLLSGGGSALLPLPAAGITLDDKLAVTRALSGAGADIQSLNVVRKHLSAIKGGKLAAACRAGRLVTLVVSDVLGDPLDLIASGPTVDDTSTPADALAVLPRFDPQRQLPESVYRVLREAETRRQAAGPRAAADGLVPHRHVVIVGNNAVAVDGAGIEAERRGYSHAMSSARRSEGAAEDVGKHLAEMALSMLKQSAGNPDCLITGGEPVVRLAPPAERGRGGRNQQLVLAALKWLMDREKSIGSRVRDRIVLLSGGTDGEDGPTDAAGAMLDGRVWRGAIDQGLDPADYLRRNDAYTFFERTGGLIKTGPTHTNVCDVRVVVVDRA